MRRFTLMQRLILMLALLLTAAVAHAQDFIVGAALQVARDGPLSVTFLSNTSGSPVGGLRILYSTTDTGPSQHDRFGFAVMNGSLSTPGTTVEARPNASAFPSMGQSGFFPQGTHLMLSYAANGQQFAFTTGGIGKDVRVDPVAGIVFRSDHTAVVCFPIAPGATPSQFSGFDVQFGLSNVSRFGS